MLEKVVVQNHMQRHMIFKIKYSVLYLRISAGENKIVVPVDNANCRDLCCFNNVFVLACLPA